MQRLIPSDIVITNQLLFTRYIDHIRSKPVPIMMLTIETVRNVILHPVQHVLLATDGKQYLIISLSIDTIFPNDVNHDEDAINISCKTFYVYSRARRSEHGS